MTFGTGPQALVALLASNWQATRSGRPDVPDVPRDGSGNALTDDDAHRAEADTVLITSDRDVTARNQNVHDVIHCYHPEGGAIDTNDRGHVEQEVIETIQVDIEAADRTDSSTGDRLSARERMVGLRSDSSVVFNEGGPYPGLFGEVKLILEENRRGHDEWDVNRHDVTQMRLLNSNAIVSLTVELEHVAINTADA